VIGGGFWRAEFRVVSLFVVVDMVTHNRRDQSTGRAVAKIVSEEGDNLGE